MNLSPSQIKDIESAEKYLKHHYKVDFVFIGFGRDLVLPYCPFYGAWARPMFLFELNDSRKFNGLYPENDLRGSADTGIYFAPRDSALAKANIKNMIKDTTNISLVRISL